MKTWPFSGGTSSFLESNTAKKTCQVQTANWEMNQNACASTREPRSAPTLNSQTRWSYQIYQMVSRRKDKANFFLKAGTSKIGGLSLLWFKLQCNCNIFTKILCIYCGYLNSPTFVVYLKSSEAKIWKDHSLGLLFTNKSILSTRTGFWWKIWQCLTTRLFTATKQRSSQTLHYWRSKFTEQDSENVKNQK